MDSTGGGQGTRVTIDLSDGWTFVRGRMSRRWLASLSADGEAVDLPHCWNATDGFQERVAYYRGYGSYRRPVTFPPPGPEREDRVWRIESEGFYGTGDVWIDGRRLARVDGQYLGFSLDPTPHLEARRDHILGVRLTNRCRSYVLPGIRMPDFLLHGGLAGCVRLLGLPRVHFLLDALRIWTPRARHEASEVRIGYGASNAWDEPKRCTIAWSILDAEGRQVAESPAREQGVPAREAFAGMEAAMTVSPARLWSISDPALYTAVGRLFVDGRLVDTVQRRFGFRAAEFRPDAGFFLNGERVELRGCNRHESMPGFGSALPANLHRADAVALKGLGANFVRLSHYPQHPSFLDACDELGLLVYAEIATWKSVRTGRWLDSACRQMMDLIRRDRNHPCIILWGMGNESRSRRAYRKLRDVAADLDPTRPVTYAENHFHRARRGKVTGLPDVWGCNYELDRMEEGRDASRLRCVVVSECSNYPPAERGDLAEEAAQTAIIERDLAVLRTVPFVAGFALWCFNDYATLRKRRYKRYSGVVDAWRVPKMSAALMQALFVDGPVLKLFGDWSVEGKESTREIHVLTNCERLELSSGGKAIPSLNGGPHQVLPIVFSGQPLVVRGVWRGRPAEDTLLPWGRAARVAANVEESTSDAAARNAIGFRVTVVDADNRPALNWRGEATVDVGGPARFCAYTPAAAVRISGGVGRGFVRGTGQEGAVVLTVRAPGLESGRVEIRFERRCSP